MLLQVIPLESSSVPPTRKTHGSPSTERRKTMQAIHDMQPRQITTIRLSGSRSATHEKRLAESICGASRVKSIRASASILQGTSK